MCVCLFAAAACWLLVVSLFLSVGPAARKADHPTDLRYSRSRKSLWLPSVASAITRAECSWVVEKVAGFLSLSLTLSMRSDFVFGGPESWHTWSLAICTTASWSLPLPVAYPLVFSAFFCLFHLSLPVSLSLLLLITPATASIVNKQVGKKGLCEASFVCLLCTAASFSGTPNYVERLLAILLSQPASLSLFQPLNENEEEEVTRC